MAFEGWILKINNVVFLTRLIAFESLKITPDQIMDLDPYRNATGLLHRTALPHTAISIEFSTTPLFLADLEILNQFITKENRVKCEIEYWNPNTSSYTQGTFYITDVVYEFIYTNEEMGIALHKSIKITFTEY